MSLIVLQNIQKSYQGEVVLGSSGLVLNRGDKTGLVGRNGCGKTTLLGIAAGTITPDGGTRNAAGSPSIGMLDQIPDFDGARTVFEAGAAALHEIDAIEKELSELSRRMEEASEDEKTLNRLIQRHAGLEERFRLLGGYASHGRVEAVLKGVGFQDGDFEKAPDQLSGGEAKRLQLAMVLLGGHEILFLDEPGNHLDLTGTEWLTEYLKEYRGTLLIVSHDRYLLNGVVNQIVQIADGRTHLYKGNYDYFLDEYPRRAEAAQKQKEHQDKLIARGEEFIRRNFYGQKSRQAKSKRKMLDRLERVEVFRPEDYPHFRFTEGSLRGDHMLRFEKLSAVVGQRTLFEDLDLELETGETLGIIGPNGSGKTTLLNIIMDKGRPASGEVWLSTFAQVLYFDQQLKGLGDSGALLDEMRVVLPRATNGELQSHLARFLFKGDEADKDLAALSGGEKSRALLAKLTLAEANLLVLDEPTNHLDIYCRESLELALKAFQGTAVIVSHDRQLLDGVVDKLLVLGGPKPELHMGSYTAYAERIRARHQEAKQEEVRQKKGKPLPRKKAQAGGGRVKRKHTYEELEAMIIAREERLKEIE
ncbi:MAG: ABC-F family ATP-binding cassette domain-containing protein, partial [Planctomycetota bacterium]